MQSLIYRPARTARWALVLAAGLAMLLPLPARCFACVATAGECPHCLAANPVKETSPASKTCCQHRSGDRGTQSIAVAADSVKHATHTCGCVLQAAPRTVPTAEKLVTPTELAVMHATSVFAAIPTINAAAAGVSTLADLPPSVPHRILHCSWII